MESSGQIEAAVEAWRQELGEDAVVLDARSIKQAQTATFASLHRVLAIIKPSNTAQVQEALKIASRWKVPVHPTSRGRNWGMGSTAPSADRTVLLDLSGLRRIRDLDDTLGVARIEAGVSFRELHQALLESGATHRVPVIGGPADASVLANMLMRGDRIGPNAGHLDELCDLEVVLPTGELLRTGFGRFGESPAGGLEPWGVGPVLSGLFSQSNLGVVTAATVPLRKPASVIHTFGFALKPAELAGAVDALRNLVQSGALEPRCLSFWNEYKRRASEGRYPWRETRGQTPLHLPDRKWTVLASVHAPSEGVASALRQHLVDATHALGTEHWWDEAPTEPTVRGTPTDANLGSVYWRSRSVAKGALDPSRDGCGLIWLCHVLPFDGERVVRAVDRVEVLMLGEGFEPNIGFQVSSARAVRFFTAIAYDRRIEDEDARAMACHDRLMEVFAELGHLPFRLGIQSQKSLPATDDTHSSLLRALKDRVDPAGILAPGLYDPSSPVKG